MTAAAIIEHADQGDVRVELRDHRVAVTTLNRPERLNAVSGQTFVDLAKVLRELGGDSRCGTIVLTGAGTSFSAGMDFATPLGDGEGERVAAAYGDLRRGVTAILAMREIAQPVIAAVRGHAVGAGFALAAATDIRICSPDAQFSAPFVKLGVSVGDLGLSWLLPRLIGAGQCERALRHRWRSRCGRCTAARPRSACRRRPTERGHRTCCADCRAAPAVDLHEELLNATITASGFREHLELEMRSQVVGLLTRDHENAVLEFLERDEQRRRGSGR